MPFALNMGGWWRHRRRLLVQIATGDGGDVGVIGVVETAITVSTRLAVLRRDSKAHALSADLRQLTPVPLLTNAAKIIADGEAVWIAADAGFAGGDAVAIGISIDGVEHDKQCR